MTAVWCYNTVITPDSTLTLRIVDGARVASVGVLVYKPAVKDSVEQDAAASALFRLFLCLFVCFPDSSTDTL